MSTGFPPASPPPRRRFHWPVALTLLAAIFAALIAFIFFRLETWPGRTAAQGTAELERIARKVRNAFVEMAHLQPRVTVNDRVYFEQTTATAELTLLSRRTEVEHEFMHTWAGSTKRIKVHGTFAVKAGFDLRERFAVAVKPNEITVEIPPAQILGVEQQQVDVLEFDNGFWNRISAADLESELALLPALAREKATAAGLGAETETALKQRIDEMLHPDRPVRVLFATPPPSAPLQEPLRP